MSAHPHLDDGKLMALIDQGPVAVRDHAVEAHLARCASCSKRYEVMRRRSENLSGLFAAEAASRPHLTLSGSRPDRDDGGARRFRRRVAVAGLALLLGTLALSPVAAVVIGWVSSPEREAPPPPSREAPDNATRYGFGVDGGTLTIVLEEDEGLTLRVRVEDLQRGSVTVAGGDGSEEVVLRQGRVDLRGVGAEPIRYDVVVPRGVEVSVIRSGVVLEPEWIPDASSVPRTWLVAPQRLGPTSMPVRPGPPSP